FIEDINEEPYRIDRMLTHLKNCGVFENTKCLFIDFNKCKPSEKNKGTISIKKSILEIFKNYDFPVVDFPCFGHRPNKIIIPIGVKTKVEFIDQNFGLENHFSRKLKILFKFNNSFC
ncbi:hypothetical protein KA977_13670, partial [Candidatus Dependentiae bacterium]|nr:hypothetical protein [Candidatus Dependentiae bacterium]